MRQGGSAAVLFVEDVLYVVKCIQALSNYQYKWKSIFLIKHWHNNIEAVSPLFNPQNGSDYTVWYHMEHKARVVLKPLELVELPVVIVECNQYSDYGAEPISSRQPPCPLHA